MEKKDLSAMQSIEPVLQNTGTARVDIEEGISDVLNDCRKFINCSMMIQKQAKGLKS
jgi:hypothetical protein